MLEPMEARNNELSPEALDVLGMLSTLDWKRVVPRSFEDGYITRVGDGHLSILKLQGTWVLTASDKNDNLVNLTLPTPPPPQSELDEADARGAWEPEYKAHRFGALYSNWEDGDVSPVEPRDKCEVDARYFNPLSMTDDEAFYARNADRLPFQAEVDADFKRAQERREEEQIERDYQRYEENKINNGDWDALGY